MPTLHETSLELLHAAIAARPLPAVAAGKVVLIGLIGRGIQSSRSPIMHEREATRLGLRCTYSLVDFDRFGLADDALPAILSAGAEAGFQGFNVTHPFKQQIISHLDRLSPEANAIGAVNTVVYAGGHTMGHNTDSWGFAESFRNGLPGAPLDRVVQFGAGGAGAAVAHALLDTGVADLTLIDNNPVHAHTLATRLSGAWHGRSIHVADNAPAALATADGIVNTTPVGMAKYPGMPFPASLLHSRHWVAEIIYFPEETALLRAARATGCRTLAGTGMAVGQAVRAFELFTGRKSDMQAMAGHFAAAA